MSNFINDRLCMELKVRLFQASIHIARVKIHPVVHRNRPGTSMTKCWLKVRPEQMEEAKALIRNFRNLHSYSLRRTVFQIDELGFIDRLFLREVKCDDSAMNNELT